MEQKRTDKAVADGGDDFLEKSSESPFDVWGTEEEEDAAQRRRDPLRRPGSAVTVPDVDEEL